MRYQVQLLVEVFPVVVDVLLDAESEQHAEGIAVGIVERWSQDEFLRYVLQKQADGMWEPEVRDIEVNEVTTEADEEE